MYMSEGLWRREGKGQHWTGNICCLLETVMQEKGQCSLNIFALFHCLCDRPGLGSELGVYN